MTYAYEIKYFDREYGFIGVQFEGKDCYNFPAPQRAGVYMSGQELEDAIQALYPYTLDERKAFFSTVSGGDDIQAKVQTVQT